MKKTRTWARTLTPNARMVIKEPMNEETQDASVVLFNPLGSARAKRGKVQVDSLRTVGSIQEGLYTYATMFGCVDERSVRRWSVHLLTDDYPIAIRSPEVFVLEPIALGTRMREFGRCPIEEKMTCCITNAQ